MQSSPFGSIPFDYLTCQPKNQRTITFCLFDRTELSCFAYNKNKSRKLTKIGHNIRK